MIIHFSPAMSDGSITLSKNGDVLTVNGDALDFSDLPEGGEYPAEAIDNEFIIGGVKRVDGKVNITIRLPYTNPNPPHSVAFPAPLIVDQDGAIALPEGLAAEVQNAD
ncbi:hypothetical protein [Ochrobactrum sp. Marseille-Q0166]|uniref:hypothetical protein n=1 Tax=Ochrobactrum sp. Marseille-Q0166 TaxID=2761105 RepID=UPI001655284E|nr:hypothetical protein [Ochrobactrum sp. Marseille-Q0166]MBC8718840.1 hypothetical protein [Ochrobactrum sp. Marseille-Q0166]